MEVLPPIGGYQPLTLSDFPGHVASIVFTQGCNLNCPFCHNRELIPIVDTGACCGERALEEIKANRTKLDGVVITGGEPLIHPGIEVTLSSIKEMGLKTKLDTNGTNPHRLEALIKKRLVDMVAMDIKAPWDKYGAVCGVRVDVGRIKGSLELLLDHLDISLFRTTVVPGLLDSEEIAEIRAMLPAGARYVEQAFVPPRKWEERGPGGPQSTEAMASTSSSAPLGRPLTSITALAG